MSRLEVRSGEKGQIRVFTLDLPPRDLKRLTDPGKAAPTPQASVAMLVGLDWLEEGGFEIFDPEVLGEMGLAGYLVDGGGVARTEIEADTPHLNAIDTPVLILYSRAFGGKPARLVPGPGVTLIGQWTEETPPVIFEPLSSAAATGVTGQTEAPKTNPPLNVLFAILALPLAAAIIGLILYGILR